MEFDPKEYNELEIFLPSLSLLSPYTIDGNIFFFPIKGSGSTNFTFGKVKNRTFIYKFFIV